MCHYITQPLLYTRVFPREWVQGDVRDPDRGSQCTMIFVINKGMLNSKKIHM